MHLEQRGNIVGVIHLQYFKITGLVPESPIFSNLQFFRLLVSARISPFVVRFFKGCLIGFSNPLCGQEICSPQLQVWVGQDRPLTTKLWDSLLLTCPLHDSWVQSKGKYYRPVPDTTSNLDTGTRKLHPPEPPASAMPVSTVVPPDSYKPFVGLSQPRYLHNV